MMNISYTGNFFKLLNFFYLLYSLGFRIPFEILTGLSIINFGLFNIIWYAFSLVLLIFHFYYNGFYLRTKNGLLTILVYSFFVLQSYIVVFYNFVSLDLIEQEYKTMYLGYIFSSYSYFCVGLSAYYASVYINFRYLLGILIFSVSPLLIITDYSSLSIPVKALFEDVGVNYLLFGDLISFLFFLFVYSVFLGSCRVNTQVKIVVFLVYILVLFTLYVNGSRTSFAIFFISSIVFFVYLNFKLNLKNISVSFFLLYCFSLFAFYIYNLDINYSEFNDSRMLSILSSRTEDGSLVARGLIKEYGLDRIQNNFFEGDLGGQVIHPYGGSPLGSYIHNFISYLSQFGVGTFALFCLSWLLVFYNLFKKNRLEFSFSIMFLVFSILSLILSRAFVHTIYFAYWAFCFSIMYGGVRECIYNREK